MTKLAWWLVGFILLLGLSFGADYLVHKGKPDPWCVFGLTGMYSLIYAYQLRTGRCCDVCDKRD